MMTIVRQRKSMPTLLFHAGPKTTSQLILSFVIFRFEIFQNIYFLFNFFRIFWKNQTIWNSRMEISMGTGMAICRRPKLTRSDPTRNEKFKVWHLSQKTTPPMITHTKPSPQYVSRLLQFRWERREHLFFFRSILFERNVLLHFFII